MKPPKNYKPRFFHWLYALVKGYFWLPCPICGRKFGGHEKGGYLMQGWHSGTGVCSMCAEEADRRNEQWMKENPFPVQDLR